MLTFTANYCFSGTQRTPQQRGARGDFVIPMIIGVRCACGARGDFVNPTLIWVRCACGDRGDFVNPKSWLNYLEVFIGVGYVCVQGVFLRKKKESYI